jgi:hypothetical protein
LLYHLACSKLRRVVGAENIDLDSALYVTWLTVEERLVRADTRGGDPEI